MNRTVPSRVESALQTLKTLPEVVEGHARNYPTDIAIICGDRRVSFQDLGSLVRRTAQALRASGVRAGDRIAYMDKNGWEFAVLSLAAMEAGVVLVPVNWRLSGPEIVYIVRHSECVLAVVGAEFFDDFASLGGELPALREILAAGKGGDGKGSDGKGDGSRPSFENWLDGGIDQPLGDPIDPSAVAFQMYTSGTTGKPKGAMITNENFSVALPVTAVTWGIDPHSTPLISSPVFHIAGIAYALAGLWNAGTLVIVREATPVNLLEAIATHRVTSSLLVPAMILMLLDCPESSQTDLSSLRRIAYGAAPISQDVLTRAMALFRCDFVQAYGLTETTGVVVELPTDVHRPGYERPDRLRAAGRPLDGVEIRISEGFGEELPDGEVGEIWIRTKQNMIGYWSDVAATADALTVDGWFRSGDVGYLRDGYLFINDRLKDMIITGGENVYSSEVENALMGHPDVADCAVIGIPHETWGETVKAVVVLRSDADVDDQQILDFCRERLARFKCPSSIDFVDVLPRNAAGKILKRELRLPYWESESRMIS
ncbi:hypothetical protein B2J88_07685 [Rhodococcus sp. SRB_17]|nr:hypothetical protein [Rhodococcus sp. SRB_17]